MRRTAGTALRYRHIIAVGLCVTSYAMAPAHAGSAATGRLTYADRIELRHRTSPDRLDGRPAVASPGREAPRSPAADTLTQAPAAGQTPAIRIGSASGHRGEIVEIPVFLDAPGLSIAGVQVDIARPNPGLSFLLTGTGHPACVVNPEIDKPATVFGFPPPGCSTDEECSRVRAFVLSFQTTEPIPDGSLLFTCRVRIAEQAEGIVPLTCELPLSSTPDGLALATHCSGGGAFVEPPPSNPTFTPTATPTPPPSSPSPVSTVGLAIGSATGHPGEIVQIPVRLDAGSEAVAGATLDLLAPNGGVEFLITGAGRPDCTVNPAIDKPSTDFAFLPIGCVTPATCAGVRAIVLSFYDVSPIPDGVALFTCRLRVTAQAAGIAPVVCANAATGSVPRGGSSEELPTKCTGGGVLVTLPTATPTASPSATRSLTPSASPTPTSTSTPPPSATATVPTATASPSSTSSATATQTPIPCIGDCDGDGQVAVAELVRGVAIALDVVAIEECREFDRNADGKVAVFELIEAVTNALGACRAPV